MPEISASEANVIGESYLERTDEVEVVAMMPRKVKTIANEELQTRKYPCVVEEYRRVVH